MIRFTLIIIFLFFFFLISLFTFFPFLLIVGAFDEEKKNRMSHIIVSGAFRIIMFIAGTKVDVIGYGNIPKDKAVLYVGNHRSYFDIVINYAILPPCVGFVSKKEMKKIPVLAWWMVFVNCLFLDRNSIKQGMKIIVAGVEKLKKGISMFIFPEGTRSRKDNEMLEFKEGSLKMAEKAGSLIIPVAITNSSACLEDQFPRVKKAHVIVEYGKPIDLSCMDKEEKKHVGAYTRGIIQKTVNKNRELI